MPSCLASDASAYHELLPCHTGREGPETKRRLHNLLSASGLLDQLHMIKPRHATFEEVARWGREWAREGGDVTRWPGEVGGGKGEECV